MVFTKSFFSDLRLTLSTESEVRVVVSDDHDGFQWVRIFIGNNVTPEVCVMVSGSHHDVKIERIQS